MKFTVGREGKKGVQKTLFVGTQLHQHLCKENWTVVKCTSQMLGEYTLSVLLHLDRIMNVLPCGLVVNVTNRWLGCSKLLFPNKLVLESPNARMVKETVTS